MSSALGHERLRAHIARILRIGTIIPIICHRKADKSRLNPVNIVEKGYDADHTMTTGLKILNAFQND